jgi:hypothetical protein
MVAAVAAACASGISATAAGAASRCHPGGRVMAQRNGVVIWSVLRNGRSTVYLCAQSRGGAHVVSSGGRFLNPHVSRLKVAGQFAAFQLITTINENVDLVVFNFVRGRRVLTQHLGCEATHACVFAQADTLTQYALASNGWVAEVWALGPPFMVTPSPFVNGDRKMVATNDAVHFYSIDFGSTFSPLTMAAGIVHWTGDLSGASSVRLGPGLIPSPSAQPLTPCELLTTSEVARVLGPNSTLAPPGTCGFSNNSNPAMSLFPIFYSHGLSAADESAAESALQSAGCDSKMSDIGGIRGYLKTTTTGGVTYLSVRAFLGDAELSMDLSSPGANAGEQLAWLSHVALNRLFAVSVQRGL